MNKLVKGNLAMGVSKTFSGLNENALRYLLPRWMSAVTGVMLRLGFGCVAFWVLSLCCRDRYPDRSTRRERWLMAAGGLLMTGYMIFLLKGLSYTTPVVSSIFICTEPIWVFLMAVMFFHERVTWMKVVGIALGLGGACLIIFTQKSSDIATRPLLGALCCLGSSIVYSVYLVVSKQFMRNHTSVIVSKWTFTGGAIGAIPFLLVSGWSLPMFSGGIHWWPVLVLAFVLIFPTFIGYLLVDVGLKNLTATVVSLYGYLILIVAAVVSYIVGQDRFEWTQPPAFAMIIASVYFVEIAERKSMANR